MGRFAHAGERESHPPLVWFHYPLIWLAAFSMADRREPARGAG